METLNTTSEERLLIHSFKEDVDRITNDAQSRAALINSIDLSKDEILVATCNIERYIEQRVLTENKELKKLASAGINISSLQYSIPPHLEQLKSALMRFSEIRVGQFQFLMYNEASGSWQVNNDELEKHFIERKLKFYVSGKDLLRYKQIEALCELLNHFAIPWNHIRDSSSMARIIEANGYGIKPNWRFFRRD